ncbi:hypothetical protein BKA61DRAFT_478632, partial [Leptodontidium sp. MPI-SDFR-AT-0119]
IRVLDASSCVCKSDGFVSTDILENFSSAVAPLRQESRRQIPQAEEITNLVDPSMYPLYYGRTNVLNGERQVGLDGCVESCFSRNATMVSTHLWPLLPEELVKVIQEEHRSLTLPNDTDFYKYYSLTFQWLPCEIKYIRNKEAPIRITSYINNSHPTHNKLLYKVMERIIASSIPLWSKCLFKGNSRYINGGVAPIRIRTYGYNSARNNMIVALHPEPGTAFSYEAWKEGRNGKVIVGALDFVDGDKVPMQAPDPDEGLYDLQETF